ncbi:MAG: trigger factor [Nitrospirae bacterium]|nr:MAG: trigger factor [Nitrospirota bacterium]
MQKTVEDINPTKKRFTVEIPAELIEERITDRLKQYGRSVKIPGFRPGKAPLSLLNRKFGKDAETDVLERVIPEYYFKAIQDEKVVPVSPPQFEDYNFKRNTPFKMTFTVEIRPEIMDLTYEGIEVTDEEIDVTEEEIENTLDRLRIEKSSYEKVDDEIKEDDLVVVDYRIVEEDQEVKDQFIKVGSDMLPQDISDALLGKKVDDTFSVKTTFPEDFPNDNLKGKTLTLEGTIKESKRLREAELNEEFAKDLGFDTVEDLRKQVEESIIKAKKELVVNRQKGEIIKHLIETHDFEIPEGLLKNEISLIENEEKRKNPEVDLEKMKDEITERATKAVKLNLLLDTIAEKENVQVSDEELRGKILEYSRNFYMSPDDFMKMYLPDEDSVFMFRQNLIREKAIDLVHEKSVKVKKETERETPQETEPKGEEK